MQNKTFFVVCSCVAVLSYPILAEQAELGKFYPGQDLHLVAPRMTVYEAEEADSSKHILLLENGFSMSIGANRMQSDSALVWLNTVTSEYRGRVSIDYNCQVYLKGNVSIQRGRTARTTEISHVTLEQGQVMVARFLISGEVFATANEQLSASVSELEGLNIYQAALEAFAPIQHGPVISKEAMVPKYYPGISPAEAVAGTGPSELPELIAAQERPKPPPLFKYPVNIVGVRKPAPEFTRTAGPDETSITTVIGRFYLWQKQDEEGGLIEFQADNAVIFHT